ncbi:MAG: hypothetical protein NVSMB7_09440 [Chitinophagaceae bacterium]
MNISSVRPGASGNDPKAPNAANYDEAKANPYPVLPDPLTLKNGTKVTTMEMNGTVQVRTRKLIGHVDNSFYHSVTVNIDLTLSTPVNATAPVPVIMEFGFVFPPGFRMPAVPRDTMKPAMALPPGWQQQCLARGWGYAVLVPPSVQADNGAGLKQGIIGLMNKGQPRIGLF